MAKVQATLALILVTICLAEEQNYTSFVLNLSSLMKENKYRGSSWERLAYLTDTYGPRMWGSDSLEEAIKFMLEEAKKIEFNGERFHNPRLEKLEKFTAWIRKEESLVMTSPRRQKLDVIGLGGSENTVTHPLNEVEVIVVVDEEDLKNKNATNKIVCFNNPWEGYSTSVKYRVEGASIAAKYGAVGVLVRSVASSSIYSVHAGYMEYDEKVSKKIPCAAITVEDAEMFSRMQERGQKITVNLNLNSKWETRESSNLIFEIEGSDEKLKSEIVVAGGHIDTWDTGSQTGASDDGGGFITVFEAFRLLFENGFRPRRTLRFVAWSGEESGSKMDGAAQYFKKHLVDQETKEVHAAAFENDEGTTLLQGIIHSGPGEELVKFILSEYMSLLNASNYTNDYTGADIEAISDLGIPTFANLVEDSELADRYFRYHHTAGDSMAIMDPDEMDSNVVGIAAFLYIIADLEKTVNYVEKEKVTNLNLKVNKI